MHECRSFQTNPYDFDCAKAEVKVLVDVVVLVVFVVPIVVDIVVDKFVFDGCTKLKYIVLL